MNLSVCGIDCDGCGFFADKKCMGCRKAAASGKCVWNGRCELYDCSVKKEVPHCGKCGSFPCDTLKEWAANENCERIENLKALNEREASAEV